MERLGTYLSLVVFFFTTVLAVVFASEKEELKQCAKHIGEHCGKQVFQEIFGHNKSTISTSCCYKVFHAGYSCNIKHTISILENNPKYKNVDRISFITKSDKIFQKCDLLTKPESQKYLAKCTAEIGTKCGEEVYNSLIHNKNMTRHCCEKLEKMGEKCHINMAKALVRTPKMKNVDADHLLKKNKKIFDHCKHVK